MEGRNPETYRFDVHVAGTGAAPLLPDLGPKQRGSLTLDLEPVGDLRASLPSRLVVLITPSVESNVDISSLTGTAAHIALFDAGSGSFYHIDATITDGGLGPSIAFSHLFAKSGLYKVWLQFDRGNQETKADWVIEVKK